MIIMIHQGRTDLDKTGDHLAPTKKPPQSMMALLALLMLLAQQAAADLSCRPQGPIVPPPLDLDASPAFRLAADRLAQALDGAVNGSIPAGWAAENGSFSVALVSVGQRDPKVPLWEYHHLARGNVRGTRRLDRDSQYLIGSISKVVTGAVPFLAHLVG
ncbi:hypothetical protein GGTG_14139 [Gaeumannomyces tritici R3-111a-1]|uniref:Beta-lactamase-related domain-containing protein n=1 Tax=Gaeumannomyces tritici (strain R3-111a-1) TaxID=644352 RepID=J3PKS2_GAET3|nr:hypothetical protein GGTG_14139 [Gaeumannomyces tritici R3-111a-1]EJT68283.1 hypothetical protein GGTG_14139 [Gaeumannomyces tritici R3-111a-1]